MGWTVLRNFKIRLIYKGILKPLLFLMDAEKVHDRFIFAGRFLGRHKLTFWLSSLCFNYKNSALRQKILGIEFQNPIGLAAGFDKEAYLCDILPAVGFGFEEVGSITGQPCKGNPKPRLWRLIKSKSLAVYYGLKNNGCEEISSRLKSKQHKIPIGINIAKTNSPEFDRVPVAVQDYVKSYRAFASIGDYFTVNVSCPNTLGGEPFLDPKNLDELLSVLDPIKTNKPVFVKISPDLDKQQVSEILEVLGRHKIDGIICSNLTRDREKLEILDEKAPLKGGLSGKLVEESANELLKYVYKKTQGKYAIIGCGGVFSAADAYKKIRLGASLVQLITGMIYEGPQLISEINLGLVRLLKKDGFTNIAQAVGEDNK